MPREFRELSWWDWGMLLLRIIHLRDEKKQELESRIELTRQFMALFANANRDTKKRPTPFRPEEFFTLSYDTQLSQEVDPELFKTVASRLGSTIKKKDSGGK